MKKNFLLFLVVIMAIQFNALADRINIPGLNLPKLIITEVRPDGEATAYVELTNVGTTPINLATSENEYFVLESVFYNTRLVTVSDSVFDFQTRSNATLEAQIGKVYLKGIIQPGESYVVATVWDHDNVRQTGIPVHNTRIAELGNQFVHKDESDNTYGWIDKPEWQCFGKDSVYSGVPTEELLRGDASAGYLIRWFYTTDSVTYQPTYIDQFNFFKQEGTGNLKGNAILSIAGVADAMTTSVMVRKASVKKGNLNWDSSRGADAEFSEWLVVPKNSSRQAAFTTVGVHGTYDLNYTVNDPATIILNEPAKTISVPWELVRGDELASYFDLGLGMSWAYVQNASFTDSAAYIARTGDKFSFYAVGDVLKQVDYTLQVREAEPDLAMVFPRRRLDVNEEIVNDPATGINDTIFTRSWSNFVYAVVEGTAMDSIINVPFATRIDTLYKYLDKPAAAQMEIVFVDDATTRIDLKLGDLLKVTSENKGTVKEYFIKVDDHVVSENALLSTVTWPDVDKTLYPSWIVGDTLPDFNPLKTEYTIELRSDAKKIPAFHFITQDFKSKIKVKNAVDIDGNFEQRTTSVTVTAESDTTSLTYNFLFVKRNAPVQPNYAEPFISQLLHNINTQGYAVELYNPGTEDLDMSQYVYVRGNAGQTWQSAVATLIGTDAGSYSNGGQLKIYKTHYFPSKRWAADGSLEEWALTNNTEFPDRARRGFLRDDNQTDPWVLGGDVFVAGIGMSSTNENHIAIRNESDFIFRGNEIDNTLYAWDSTLILHRETPVWTTNYTYLLKVLNDSILDGTKIVTDPDDYELIDRFDVISDSLAGIKIGGANSIIRKPSVSKGNVDPLGGGSETPESSEWIVVGGHQTAGLGAHAMDPITNYLSTVTSLKLNVTAGYDDDDLSITGNIVAYTPTTIALVLDKADASQTFEFKRGETVLTVDQSLAEGDVLEVTSGDGRSRTIYALINSPLDNNTTLTPKAGSGLTVNGNKVSGVTFGMSLKETIANLEVAEKSILNVLDATTGALQPLTIRNLDSVKVDVMVSKNVILQVVAENSDSWNYTFDFGYDSSKAILGSNILKIDQAKMQVMELPLNSTVASFLSLVYANEGATVRILDKAGFERTIGFMNVDDEIEVRAANGIAKAIYGLNVEGHYNSINRSVESATKVVLFPMPVTYVLNIQGLDLASVQVYTLSGTMIMSQTSSSTSVDVSGLTGGVYVIKMTDVNGNVSVEKFLKK